VPTQEGVDQQGTKGKSKGKAGDKSGGKARDKDKQARKALKERARSHARSAGKRPNDKAGGKRAKFARLLADELSPLRGALGSMEGRLADLHGRIEVREQASAVADDRAAALADAVAAAQASGTALGRRVEALAAMLEGLIAAERQRSSAGSGPIDDLESRLAGIESALAQVAEARRRDLGTGPSAAVLAGRLAALGTALESQGRRLAEVEQGHAETRTMPATLAEGWRAELLTLREDLDGRLEGLSHEIDRARSESREQSQAQRESTEVRMRRMARNQARWLLALGLVSLLTLGLLGAAWWRGELAAGGAAERLAALEQGPAAAAMAPARPVRPLGAADMQAAVQADGAGLTETLTRISGQLERMETALPAGAVLDDLLERLRRAEDRLTSAAGALGERRASSAALEPQLAELAGAQLALDDRVARLARPSGAAAPVIATAQPVQSWVSPVSALTQAAYGIQLVFYADTERLRPFAERYGLAGRAVVVDTRVRGRDGYAVLTGPFATESEARLALAELSPELRALDPWVRRLPAGSRLMPLE
jgi:septal ring-binding cell division protein DamX